MRLALVLAASVILSPIATQQGDATRRSADTTRAQRTDTATRAARPARQLSAEELRLARRDSVLDALWPVKGPEPLPGAILPEKRTVAYYGNPPKYPRNNLPPLRFLRA